MRVRVGGEEAASRVGRRLPARVDARLPGAEAAADDEVEGSCCSPMREARSAFVDFGFVAAAARMAVDGTQVSAVPHAGTRPNSKIRARRSALWIPQPAIERALPTTQYSYFRKFGPKSGLHVSSSVTAQKCDNQNTMEYCSVS